MLSCEGSNVHCSRLGLPTLAETQRQTGSRDRLGPRLAGVVCSGVQCKVCSIQCTLCSLVCSVPVFSFLCAVCSEHCAVCSVQCAVCIVHFIVFGFQCVICVKCIVCSV